MGWTHTEVTAWMPAGACRGHALGGTVFEEAAKIGPAAEGGLAQAGLVGQSCLPVVSQ